VSSVSKIDRVREIVVPLLEARGLDLYDVEQHGPVLRITVDRAGGIDLDAVGQATKAISLALDEHDPLPGKYTLEVSSPGLERALRTPEHFALAVGDEVNVKTTAAFAGDRRLVGTLVAADDDGVRIRTGGPDGDELAIAYGEIEKARTVFDWGPSPKPGSRGSSTTTKKTTPKTTKKKANAS
jgi:ribosome maturation factor RimP